MTRTAITISATLLGALALLAAGYAPATCACVDPATALAMHAGMGGPGNPLDFDPTTLQAALNRKLVGRPVVFGEYPYTSQAGCAQDGPDAIVCHVPIDHSLLLAREFEVTYRSSGGVFQAATVSLVRWP